MYEFVANNSTTWATSSGWPKRPTGIRSCHDIESLDKSEEIGSTHTMRRSGILEHNRVGDQGWGDSVAGLPR
jgi:hypothetical protein